MSQTTYEEKERSEMHQLSTIEVIFYRKANQFWALSAKLFKNTKEMKGKKDMGMVLVVLPLLYFTNHQKW